MIGEPLQSRTATAKPRRSLTVLGCFALFVTLGATVESAAAVVGVTVESAAETALRGLPLGQEELPTTSARIFLRNLDLEIAALETMVAAVPNDVLAGRRLASLLHLRGGLNGDLEEIQRGIELLDVALGLSPDDPTLLVFRAKQQMTLHRFDQARGDYERALAALGFGAPPSSLMAEVGSDLEWNLGEYESAVTAIRRRTEVRPTAPGLARLARLEHDLGRYQEAERLFEAAEDLVFDVDPVFVAWLNVQRGIHLFELGEYDRAEVFFREARRRMPTYVLANEHLAEVLGILKRYDESVAIYNEVLEHSSDPEIMAALALVLRRAGRPEEADVLVASAARRFDELLEKYPEAMAAHASDFFLADGRDPERALELLKRNFELRPNIDSAARLARAHLANGEVTAAREIVRSALAMPVVSPSIDALFSAPELYDLRPRTEER